MASNILVFIPNDSRAGGSDEILFQIANHYAIHAANVYIMFLTKIRFGDWRVLEGLSNVHFYSNNSTRELGGVFPSLFNVCRLRRIQFDYVYTSNTHTTSFLGILRKLGILKTKYFIGRESSSVFLRFTGCQLRLYKLYHHLGYQALDYLICQSNEMKKQFIEGTPSIAKRINLIVIPNPVNLLEMNEEASKTLDFPILFQERVIVTAGRFIKEKGFDLLIEAFDMLQKSTELQDVHLLVLGDGAERQNLEKSIKRKGLQDKVLLPGMSKNVYPYFKRATLCVISSRIEGFPNVLLQMMSQCNNVVSTKCAGGIERIKGLKTCEPYNAKALYEAIKKALETNNTANTAKNRHLFDQELEKRSIDSFVAAIESAVKKG